MRLIPLFDMKKILSIVTVLALLYPVPTGHAALSSSYKVVNGPQMFLGNSITATQTTGITLAAPQRNGVSVTFPVTSGAILRLRNGSFTEDISYTSATVNATTKVVTLVGVTRDICWNIFNNYTSCAGGLFFPKGSIVELSVDARLLNRAAKTDTQNNFTASGAINFPRDGSGTLSFPVYSTTTARDHNILPKNGVTACSDADGVCYFYMSGGWSTFGTSTTSNAMESLSGKVQLGTVSAMSGRTITDATTGAPVVAQTRYMTASGGISFRKNAVLLDNRGYLSGSVLGTGTRNATTFLSGNQTYRTPSSSGANLLFNAVVATHITFSSSTYAQISSTLSTTFNFTVGDTLACTFTGSAQRNAGAGGMLVEDLQVGSHNINGGSGSLVLNIPQLTIASGPEPAVNASFTVFHRVLTGGTLTVQPVAKIGSNSVLYKANSVFSCLIFH